MARIRMTIAAASLLLLAAALPGAAATWKGKEIVKDGERHMVSPAEPMEPAATAELKELWRLGGDTDDEDEFFGVISQIITDKAGNVYLLDTQLSQVKVFTPDGEFIRSIGRAGEGPGEFKFPTAMFFTKSGDIGVMQVQPGKIVLLTPDGEPAGEHPLPKSEDGGFITLVGGRAQGDNLVLSAAVIAFDQAQFQQTRYLASITSEGKEAARYCSDVRTIAFANAVMDDQEWDTFDRRWAVGPDGKVYAATTYPDYMIHVWNPDGSVNCVIEREYTHRKRTDKEKDLITRLMNVFARQIPNCTVRITDYTKDVETFYLRDDGSLWVLSSDGARNIADGTLGVFDVFDAEGRFVRQVTLKGEGRPLIDGYHFVGDRVYVVTDLLQAAISLQAGGESFQVGDEEPEPMSVICYHLDSDAWTSR